MRRIKYHNLLFPGGNVILVNFTPASTVYKDYHELDVITERGSVEINLSIDHPDSLGFTKMFTDIFYDTMDEEITFPIEMLLSVLELSGATIVSMTTSPPEPAHRPESLSDLGQRLSRLHIPDDDDCSNDYVSTGKGPQYLNGDMELYGGDDCYQWVMERGDKIRPCAMDEQHLRNAISFCQRRLVRDFGSAIYLSHTRKYVEGLHYFLMEAERRGLAV